MNENTLANKSLVNQLIRRAVTGHEVLDSTVVDRQIHQIASAACTGGITEHDARQAIVGILTVLDIPTAVSREKGSLSSQMRVDLADRLSLLIERKALQEGEGGLDLARLANGTSAAGWARQLARVGAASAIRDLTLLTRNVSVDPTADLHDDATPTGYADYAFHNASSKPADAGLYADDENRFNELHDEFQQATSGLRASARLLQEVTYLRSTFGWPALIRPESFVERETVRQLITPVTLAAPAGENETPETKAAVEAERERQSLSDDAAKRLPWESARARVDMVVTGESAEQRHIVDEMLYLWDDFTNEQLEKLVSLRPEVAYKLVEACVSLHAKPSRTAVRHAVEMVRMADQGKDWDTLAKNLVLSWVAAECEAVGERDTRTLTVAAVERSLAKEDLTEDEKAELLVKLEQAVVNDTARMNAGLSWPELAAEVAARPGAPLGDSIRAVGQWVESAVDAFMNA